MFHRNPWTINRTTSLYPLYKWVNLGYKGLYYTCKSMTISYSLEEEAKHQAHEYSVVLHTAGNFHDTACQV